jgi:cystathionine beta-lyase/cystathionine gamma-synthase
MTDRRKARDVRIETAAVHGAGRVKHQHGDVAMPLHFAVNFEYETLESTRTPYGYARHRHPTREQAEAAIAAVEGAAHALLLASGVAAIDVVLRGLRAGDHVVADDDLFGGTYALLERLYRPIGVEITYVDLSAGPEGLSSALTPKTRFVLLETPTNPFMRIIDIAAVSAAAHKVGAVVVVDNTFATPVLQRPLEYGADLVVYSTTKYFSGHSDLMGGAIMMNDAESYERLKYVQYAAGAVPSAFDCWLLERSIKTLAVRVERQCRNAATIAALLADHSAIEKLYFPGLETHPGHAVAKQQMSDFGAMMSFLPRGGIEAARRIYDRVRLFTRASSLGAVESLIVAPIAGPHIGRAGTANAPPAHLLRLSIGIEHVDDLMADLRDALGVAA